MKFKDITQFLTNKANYHVDVALRYFDKTIQSYIDEQGLILNPPFQRGHVWTEEQQKAYIAYLLRGGTSGKDLYFNCPSWHGRAITDYDDFVCVDGLQRITAIRKFMQNKLKVFGCYYNDFEDKPVDIVYRLSIHINDLQYEKDVLRWYVEMNEGGTPHTKEEIDKVKKMIEEMLFTVCNIPKLLDKMLKDIRDQVIENMTKENLAGFDYAVETTMSMIKQIIHSAEINNEMLVHSDKIGCEKDMEEFDLYELLKLLGCRVVAQFSEREGKE